MARFLQLALYLLVLTCSLANVEAASILVFEIPDRVLVPGPKIYLSDLGTIHGSVQIAGMDLMVDLGPAPYPGQVRVFSRDYLGLLLKQKGFNQGLDIRMGQQVEVRVESACITGEQLEAAIQSIIPSNNSSITKKWVELRNIPVETWLSKGEWQIKAMPVGTLPQVGTALFRVAISKENEVKTINVSGKIRALGWVYQSVRDLNRHSLINESDFIMIETELTSGEEILGSLPPKTRSTKIIKKGQILTTDHIQPLPLVTKENIVNVMVRGGNMTIKMTGLAGKDGWLGDQITILNPTSKKVFQGRVTGQNLVEVNL